MKKFILEILKFIFPLIIILCFLDIIISFNLKKTVDSNGEFEVWNKIYDGEIEADLAIYGSSRSWLHINPDIIEDSLNLKSYNFGVNGHNFWLQYLRHIEYIKYNENPKFIILALDIFSLDKRRDLFNYQQFLPYMLWNDTIIKYTSSYKGFEYFDYLTPFWRYSNNASVRKALKNKLLSKNIKPIRNKGFMGINEEWDEKSTNNKKRSTSYRVYLEPSSVKLFEHFLKDCNSKNIEVILVYTPEYIDGQKDAINREEVINLYKKYSKNFNLLFLDYSAHKISFSKQYFYEPNHLNSKGADFFTKILSHDIIEARMQNNLYIK